MIDPVKYHHQMSYFRLRKRRGYKGVGSAATKPNKELPDRTEPETIDIAEIAWSSPGEGRRII